MEQIPTFGKRQLQQVDAWSQEIVGTADRSEAKDVLGSLAKIGEAINGEIMKLSVAAMNGITINRERRDELLVLSKKYDVLVQALYAGNEAVIQEMLPKFLELLNRVMNQK